MKSPKTKFVVISAIGLAPIVGIFVFAQSPTPSGTSGQDLPVQLVMACVGVKKAKLLAALAKRPKDTYKFQYETEESGGGSEEVGGGTLPPMSPPPCPVGLVGNATQRATFKNTQELRAFMDKAGL
jgi:hypothetical protein